MYRALSQRSKDKGEYIKTYPFPCNPTFSIVLSFNVNLRYYLEVLFIYLTWLTEVLVLVAAGLVVFVKVGLQGEGLVALPALVVLEGGVGLHVGPQVGPVGETLPAVGAAERFVSGVRPR